jgi:hypothetical protein
MGRNGCWRVKGHPIPVPGSGEEFECPDKPVFSFSLSNLHW